MRSTLSMTVSVIALSALFVSSANAASASGQIGSPDSQGKAKSGEVKLAQADNPPADGAAVNANDEEIESVTVTAAKVRSLGQFTPTASRLGLSAQETPATLDTIDADQMIGRGLHSVEEAVDALPGVVSGGSPGDPAELSMRGFTGNQITVLRNGLYYGPSNFVNRPGNSFNLASVEVLKGPASVLYGQGAIGGVVNSVSKGASFDKSEGNYLASIGSFGTTDIGVGYTTHWGDTVAVRGDISRTGTNGYVNNSPANSLNGTFSIDWHVTETLDVQASLDYLDDNPSRYYGTPLVTSAFAGDNALNGLFEASKSPGLAIDKRMRFSNYNAGDSTIHEDQIAPTLLVTWAPDEDWEFNNHFYYYHANRKWLNSETYTFDPSTDLIDRDRFRVLHRQTMIGDQASATYSHSIFGFANRAVLGVDYSHLDFYRPSSGAGGDTVDPLDPDPGIVGPGNYSAKQTYWDDFAIFGEDALDLIPEKLKLILGGRYEWLRVNRENFAANGPDSDIPGAFVPATSFRVKWKPATWRVGLVYNITPNLTPYVSYTTGQDPVGSAVFTVNANQDFGLSGSYQEEAGLKWQSDEQTADLTVSFYNIKRKNIFLNGGQNAFIPIGYEKSNGFEVSGDVKITDDWTVSANSAYTNAYEAPDPTLQVYYEPENVPKWTANLNTAYKNILSLPLELGGGVRFIGNRAAGLPNNMTLESYTLVNTYASYEVADNTLLSFRVNNLFNKAYVNWADIFYPSELMLGAPRSFEVAIVGKF